MVDQDEPTQQTISEISHALECAAAAYALLAEGAKTIAERTRINREWQQHRQAEISKIRRLNATMS